MEAHPGRTPAGLCRRELCGAHLGPASQRPPLQPFVHEEREDGGREILPLLLNFDQNLLGVFPGKWKFETATMFLQISKFSGNSEIWEEQEIRKFESNYGNWKLQQLDI